MENINNKQTNIKDIEKLVNIDSVKKIMYNKKTILRESLYLRTLNKIKNIFNFIETVIGNQFKNYRVKKQKQSFERERQIKLVRNHFLCNYDYNFSENYPHLIEQNKEFKKHTYNTNKPLFYEPEMCNIHNEFLTDNNGLLLEDLLKYDNLLIRNKLKEQEIKHSGYLSINKDNVAGKKELNDFKKYLEDYKIEYIKMLKETE